MSYICNALHLRQAIESPIAMPAAFFMPLAKDTSSVPCGALMRPLPVSGVVQRGAELFLYPFVTIFINHLKHYKMKREKTVSTKRLRETLIGMVDDICNAQDKVLVHLHGNTFELHLDGGTINITINEEGDMK